jgi:hypothetical protein
MHSLGDVEAISISNHALFIQKAVSKQRVLANKSEPQKCTNCYENGLCINCVPNFGRIVKTN